MADRSVVGAVPFTSPGPTRRDRSSAVSLRPGHAPARATDDLLCDLIEEIQLNRIVTHAVLKERVETLDTLVWEHRTDPCDPTTSQIVMNLQPQFAQTELIEFLGVNLYLPSAVAVTNAYVNLNGDTFGVLGMIGNPNIPSMIPFRTILNSESTRRLTIVAGGNFPPGATATFTLFGKVIPATLAEALH